MKENQKEGVKWLFAAHERGGGLLTDEPGLGITCAWHYQCDIIPTAGAAL